MRAVALANGAMTVGLDPQARLSELRLARHGYRNLAESALHRVGVLVDGQLSWLGDDSWRIKTRLPQGALVAHTVAVNETLGVLLEFDDFVAHDTPLFGRHIHVVNLRQTARDVQLFLHQAFRLNPCGDDQARFLHETQTLLHYSGDLVCAVGAQSYDGRLFDQMTVGQFGTPGFDGTWRDAEDGQLSQHDHDRGQTDSTLRFTLGLSAYSSTRLTYWLVVADSLAQATALSAQLSHAGLDPFLEKTVQHWQSWLRPAFKLAQRIKPTYRQSFINSILAIKSHLDDGGAIITSLTRVECDLHEASYALWPLIRLGYQQEVVAFFEYCARLCQRDGAWLVARYRPDGSWHESIRWHKDQPVRHLKHPAAVLFMLCQFESFHSRALGQHDLYTRLAVPLANILGDWYGDILVNGHDELYSLELLRVALDQASRLAKKYDDADHMVKWRMLAEEIKGQIDRMTDGQMDSVASFYGSFMFGTANVDAARLSQLVQAIQPRGVVECLWIAQYYLETNDTPKAHEVARHVLKQVITQTGLINERGQQSLWASAEYINTLLDTITT